MKKTYINTTVAINLENMKQALCVMYKIAPGSHRARFKNFVLKSPCQSSLKFFLKISFSIKIQDLPEQNAEFKEDQRMGGNLEYKHYSRKRKVFLKENQFK